jgi:AcrR family transcriptional regulator
VDDHGAPGVRKALRRDTQITRGRLLDATGQLLAEQGPTFGLPELARHCGVSNATVYRHFDSIHDAFSEFTLRLVEDLAAKLQEESTRLHGRKRFDAACERWTREVSNWGRAAARIRSVEGFLERLHRGDPLTAALYRALSAIVSELVQLGELPAQDMDYAVLIWVTVFDERVIMDLGQAKGWPSKKTARQLGATVLGALGA